MSHDRLRRLLQALIDLAAVVTALVFIGSYFPRAIMFAETVTNGGDMGSHFYPAKFLAEVLLPKGQVVGWCPGNYCGFPLFQFYFFLPFTLIALLGKLIPLTIAFKIGTVAGTFLLPIASYLALRLAGIPFPGPALGALTPLCFLFMEANSMWGGNIPSTLAGEFTYSLGLALTVVFLGALRRTVASGRGAVATGVLVGVIGMSHGYTLLWAGFSSLVELIRLRGWWRAFGTLVVVHGLAILLMAFWLLPLIGYAPWTTAYSHTWIIKSWQEILPPVLWPPAIAAGVSLALVLLVCAVRREPFPRGLATVWWATLVGGAFYFIANLAHVVDIRFLPFMQVGLCLAAAAGVGTLLGRLPMPEIWPAVVAAALVPWVQQHVSFIPSWVKWNYAGFEAKAPWPGLAALSTYLRGDFRDPRVVYEHSMDYEALGTVRTFESLPLFSGRSTLEGLYMQGSPSAPFIFYLQSEISKQISCPFSDWGCGRIDLDSGAAHLAMMNVSQMIVRSKQVKDLLAKHPRFEREKVIEPFEVFRVKENAGRYAVPLPFVPVLVLTPTWKETAYRWWKHATPDQPTPVFADAIAPGDAGEFAAVVRDVTEPLPEVPTGSAPTLSEEMHTDRIVLTGCRPGHPVLVRISYHPRWRATTGERVWLAGPSFMLVFPKSERVELVFGDGPPNVIGQILSWIGWLLVAASLVPPLRRAAARAGSGVVQVPPFRPAWALVQRTAEWTTARRALVLGVVLAVSAAGFAVAARRSRSVDADGIYREAQKLYDAGKLKEALEGFQRAQQLAPLSATAVHSTYFESVIHMKLDDWTAAEASFRRLAERYPEAQAVPEAIYHLGIAAARRGDPAAARVQWQLVQQRFPDSPWAKHSAARLAELPPAR